MLEVISDYILSKLAVVWRRVTRRSGGIAANPLSNCPQYLTRRKWRGHSHVPFA